ncbi:unnamed protein product [Ceratitis capitata]|uniref:(Mediterranean fruit fly) hypothetical protein n=1 Tax=Ceratitis capitata TaxID=7213 RepID=A0A811UWI3_CERCA|nr:unnamed protein product [Ceratitis capitata]
MAFLQIRLLHEDRKKPSKRIGTATFCCSDNLLAVIAGKAWLRNQISAIIYVAQAEMHCFRPALCTGYYARSKKTSVGDKITAVSVKQFGMS